MGVRGLMCDRVELENGITAIVCRGHRRTKPCVTCGKPGTKLCDYPVRRKGKDATCDRAMCSQHATADGPDLDYCLAHASLKVER